MQYNNFAKFGKNQKKKTKIVIIFLGIIMVFFPLQTRILIFTQQKPNSAMASAFYEFTIPGMGAQSAFFQTQIKKNSIFPAGTRVKRLGNDLVFGATFRELFPAVRKAMNKFIYKLGTDTQVEIDAAQTAFVKQHVKFNTQKNKHLEWVMPFNSTGIVYTMTHDTDNNCLVIGAFSYLHRLNFDMIEEAAYYKQQLITAFDCEDSELLGQTKREIRRTQWNSCFDNIVLETESSDEEDDVPEPEPKKVQKPEPIALVATVTMKRPAVTFASILQTNHEIAVDEASVSTAVEQAASNPALAHLELKFCWVCDKSMDVCKC